jgi:4-hydroxybenzoate polyprenyltransferase/putative flippase GtrA
MTRTFRNFLVVGGVAALANWGSRFGFERFMGLGAAVVVAYLVGMTTAYGLSRVFVFESTGRKITDEAARFTLVNLFALGVVWLVTVCLARWLFPAVGFLWHPEAVAHGVGVLSPAVTSYLGHRHFTFAKPAETTAPTTVSAAPPAPVADTLVPLAVDLDGTLLRTDVLAEAVVAGLFRRPLSVFWALVLIPRGRARFKARMSEIVSLDVSRLPVRHSLLNYLRAERARGRSIHLVTAATEAVARRVAAHFDVFDGVHASSDLLNLKGANKRMRLAALFPDGFAYAGDSRADLAVWAGAQSLVIAGASRSVSSRARRLGKPVEAEFDAAGSTLDGWRRALRLHQWSKNLLIFVPLLLSNQVANPRTWTACLAGFALLGVAASATYLINDLADLEADRSHRTKRARALASGEIPVLSGLGVALAMLVVALTGAAFLSSAFTLALVAYLTMTLAYSFRLKQVPLLDGVILACLYTARLVCGTLLTATVFSPWLLTFSMFFFFSMSIAKRQVEISAATSPTDQTLPGRGYRPSDAPLTLSLGVATSAAAVLIIVQYMMAEAFPSNVYAFPAALWATPLLLGLWVCRIWLLAHRGQLDDDPVAFAVKDRVSLVLGGLLGAAFLLARY